MSQAVLASEDYQEVNRFLIILEKKKRVSSTINQRLIRLLDSENFILARRVYWFLAQQQELSETEQERLNAFYEKHSESL